MRVQGLVAARQHNGKEGVLLLFYRGDTEVVIPVLTTVFFVTIGRRWRVEVGEPELLAVKPVNLVFVCAAAATSRPSASARSAQPMTRGSAPALRTYASTVGTFVILLLPNGRISCCGSVGFDEDSSPPPEPVALAQLPLEAQLAVCCSNVLPSAARVHSILYQMPPATVNLARIPGVSFTLLEFAARNGQLQVVDVLLSFGADVNVQTLCLWAAYTGNVEIIEVLMQHGALMRRVTAVQPRWQQLRRA